MWKSELMAILIDGVLSESALAAATDDDVFERGVEYRDRVARLSVSPGAATALVRGSEVYQVSLRWGEIGLDGECACPHNAKGNFCKHLVAVGLAVLAQGRGAIVKHDNGADDAPSPVDSYLEGLGPERLRELVLAMAAHSPDAMRELETAAELATGDHDEVRDNLLRSCRSVLAVRGFLDEDASVDYAYQVDQFLDELEGILNEDYPEVVAPALLRVTTRLRSQLTERVDDSSGMVGSVCQRAVELYARACRKGDPDGVRLGRWLAKFRLESPGWPQVTLNDFLPALGAKGLAVYRRAAQVAAEEAGQGPDSQHHYELNTMLLELADHDGDLDLAVEILERGGHPQYAAIIDRLLDAGRRRDAVYYLNRAVQEGRVSNASQISWAGADNPFWVVPSRAVELYLADGLEDEAMVLVRELFHRTPTTENYDLLLGTAEKLGRREQEREAVIAWAENETWRNADVLVSLALHEGDVERAWEAVDRWGTGPATWEELVETRPQPRPGDAIRLYEREVEKVLVQPGRKNARQAAVMAERIRAIAAEADVEKDGSGPHVTAFQSWLNSLRGRYRRRPTVREEFDELHL